MSEGNLIWRENYGERESSQTNTHEKKDENMSSKAIKTKQKAQIDHK